MVGDTVADLKMGRVAGLKASIAVLTGVGNRDTLREYTDYYVCSFSLFNLEKLLTRCRISAGQRQ